MAFMIFPLLCQLSEIFAHAAWLHADSRVVTPGGIERPTGAEGSDVSDYRYGHRNT
jgi:hypothetical protein